MEIAAIVETVYFILHALSVRLPLSVGSHMYGVQTWPCKSRDDMFHAL